MRRTRSATRPKAPVAVAVSLTGVQELPPPPASLHEALQRESERILASPVIRGSLRQLLSCYYQVWSVRGPLRHVRPELTLAFPCEEGMERGFVDKRLPAALASLSAILVHSFRLRELPGLKAQFWERILKSDIVLGAFDIMPQVPPDASAWLWMVQDESFPVVRVNMNRRGKMTDAHMDAFEHFLTTLPRAPALGAKYEQECRAIAPSRLIPVGLVLGASKATPECLQRIQRLLCRVFASPSRLFRIDLLDLSYQVMHAPHLQCVADILRSNRSVYKIRDVCLQDVMKKNPSSEALEAMRHVVSAAFDTSALADASEPKDCLQKLSLHDNALGLEHVMALCSALRYGSTIESLDLNCTLDTASQEDREQCWRWLAFGVFHPRSKRFAATSTNLRHIDLSHNPLEPGDVDAFVKTLQNPAGELVYRGSKPPPETQFPVQGTLSICTVKKSTMVHATPKAGAGVLLVLDRDTQLEALCEQRGWRCVVLAGLGIGWVKNDRVAALGSEVVDTDTESERGRRVGLAFTSIPLASFAALSSLLGRVGRHLSYLDVSGSAFGAHESIFRDMLTHCTHLEHLVLSFNLLTDDQMDLLLGALRGDLGDRLLSLHLDKNSFSNATMHKFADFVGDPARTPALHELRILQLGTPSGVFAAFGDALRVNKRLRILEFFQPGSGQLPALECAAADLAHLRLQDNHQGEALRPSPLPRKQMLAFLSVVHAANGESARAKLDSFMVSSIFQFAAKGEQRRIFWTRPWN